MKKLKFVGKVVIGILIIAWIGGTFFIPDKTDAPVVKEKMLPQVDASKKLIDYLLETETTAKEIIINDAGVMYVAVEGDKTMRDGLASYYCEVIKEQSSLKVDKVRIMLNGSAGLPKDLKDNAYGIILGESQCY